MMSLTNPFFIRMLMFMVFIVGLIFSVFDSLWSVYQNNIELNALITAVWAFGVGLCFFNLYKLSREQTWLDAFSQGREDLPNIPEPKVLAPLAVSLKDQKGAVTISSLAHKSILTGVEARLDETRDITRYLIGVLIFLGLLGTFWGLSKTIGAIAGVISGINVEPLAGQNTFELLKEGLKSPLNGMGTAFSSSLFGLAGSLVVGFLDMQVSKAGTNFFHDLEDQLSSITKMTHDGSDVAHNGGAYALSLLEKNAEQLEQLHKVLQGNETSRLSTTKVVVSLSEHINKLHEDVALHQKALQQLMQSHQEIQKGLSKLLESNVMDQTKNLSKHIEVVNESTKQLVQEQAQGRNELKDVVQSEIRLLTRTLSAMADGQDRPEKR